MYLTLKMFQLEVKLMVWGFFFNIILFLEIQLKNFKWLRKTV
jgi:hypothetical protein